MIGKVFAAVTLVVALSLLCLPACAQTVLFSDNLESGSSNWTPYSGCTSLQYVSTSTDPNCNHTAGGSHGLAMSSATDRVYHDVDLGTYTGSVQFSFWFYDTMDLRASDLEEFDIRDTATRQVLGFGADWENCNYLCRILTAADGWEGPNYIMSGVRRTLGWHHFALEQFRGTNTVDFYIDGALVHHWTDAYDIPLDRIVLGCGWSPNVWQSGYVDDISYSAIPEPCSLATLLTGVIAAAGLRLRRKQA